LFGEKTKKALERFQIDNGLPVTGKLDQQTKEKLGIGALASSTDSQPKSVDQDPNLLIERLNNKDWGVLKESRTQDALIKIGAPVVPPIIVALGEGDAEVRTHAASILNRIGAPAFGPLIAALESENSQLRFVASLVLGDMGRSAIEPLLLALADPNPHVREGAAVALGKIEGGPFHERMLALLGARSKPAEHKPRSSAAVVPLINALKDEHEAVRREAATALGWARDARAVEPLAAALRDSSEAVRALAAWALGMIESDTATDALAMSLKDESPQVKKAAAKAMARIDNPNVRGPLTAALEERDLPSVAGASSYFIRQGQPGTEPVLIEALKAHGDQEMMKNFLSSGNQTLQNAAEEWAIEHKVGPKVPIWVTPQGQIGPIWGQH
jgi:HEAT repeat protein